MNISNRTVVLTGASSGIGQVAARQLATAGARLTLIGRDPARTRAIADELEVPSYAADFSRLSEVRRVAERLRAAHRSIDVIVNNAGGVWSRRHLTIDANETTLQVNTLAPFLLTRLLEPQLATGLGRVVMTTSVTALDTPSLDLDDLDSSRGYKPWDAYAASKLALSLLTREFARRMPQLDVVDVHPGVAITRLIRQMRGQLLLAKSPLRGQIERFISTPEEAATALVDVVVAEGHMSGAYFQGGVAQDPGALVNDSTRAARLWELCRRRTDLGNLCRDM